MPGDDFAPPADKPKDRDLRVRVADLRAQVRFPVVVLGLCDRERPALAPRGDFLLRVPDVYTGGCYADPVLARIEIAAIGEHPGTV